MRLPATAQEAALWPPKFAPEGAVFVDSAEKTGFLEGGCGGKKKNVLRDGQVRISQGEQPF